MQDLGQACCQDFVSQLHGRGAELSGEKKYKEAIECLDTLRKFIIKYHSFLGLDGNLVKRFNAEMSEDLKSNDNQEITLKDIKPLREKYLKRAEEVFTNEIDSSIGGMLVDAIIMPMVFSAAIRQDS